MTHVDVRTYTHPHDPAIAELCDREDVLHICATASLTEAMVQRGGRKHCNVISAKWFTDALLSEWMDSGVRLEQLMQLSELIRKGSPDNPIDTPIVKAIRRSRADALLTIRMLAEVGIQPQDLQACASTDYEREVAHLWERMLAKDEASGHFKKLGFFLFALNRPAAFKIMAEQRLQDQYKADTDRGRQLVVSKENLSLQHHLVLHGFYFLTPIQQRVFQALKQAGAAITFLQFYQKGWPSTFSFLEEVLGEENGWVPVEQWQIGEEAYREKEGAYFASCFEQTDSRVPPPVESPRIRQICYRHLYQWMDDFEKDTAGTKPLSYHLSANFEELDERVREFFPERYEGMRNFLSYPIGHYLLHLHSVWNQEKKVQQLDMAVLQECFASPWLHVQDKSSGEVRPAAAYLHHLQTLANFFPRKMTLKKWKEHIERLIEDIETGAFLRRDEEGEKPQQRFLDEIRNPLKKIGPYAVPAADLKAILHILQRMEAHISELFQNMDHTVTFRSYFRTLMRIMNEHVSEENGPLLEHEAEMLNKLKELADYYEKNPSERAYHIEDIAEAIHLLLAAKLDRKDEREEEGRTGKERLRSFAEVDGIVFNEQTPIHVTGLDEFSLPSTASSLPWPLTIHTIEWLGERIQAVSAFVLREKHKNAVPRFLFCTVLSGKQDITLSWFREWGGRESLGPSVYLKLLSEDVPEPNRLGSARSDQQGQIEVLADPAAVYEQELDHYSDYALSELHACPRRFYYSYLTQPYSVFRTDFHYSFLYSSLHQMLANFSSAPSQVLADVFPHWSAFKHSAKATAARRYGRPSRAPKAFSYAGYEYQALSGMKYLANPQNSPSGWKKAWKNPGYTLSKSMPSLLETAPSANCRYCPHEGFCPSARYAADDERYDS